VGAEGEREEHAPLALVVGDSVDACWSARFTSATANTADALGAKLAP
jgi:hypothetical protein